jgi:hypothetical protein
MCSMTSKGSPLTRLRRAIRSGDLLLARTAAAELPSIELDDAALLLVLIARSRPEQFEAAAIRFLGRLCLEQPPTLRGLAVLGAGLAALPDGGLQQRVVLAAILEEQGLHQAARRIGEIQQQPGERWPQPSSVPVES